MPYMSYEKYRAHMARIADLQMASSVLAWDQECYMPPQGAEFRAQQLSTLAGIAHEMFTDEALGKNLEALSADAALDARQKKNIAQSLKDYKKQKKYTREFVEEMSRAVSEAFQAWQTAKEKSDFSLYEQPLDKLITLKRKECELLGYKGHPYDALLDQYEPGLTTKECEVLFLDVRNQLVDFVKKIAAKPQLNDEFMKRNYPKDKQWDFGIKLLKQMGYDFDKGRQDISSHPFTIHFNANDVRVTTRVNENNLHEMIWSCIHEGGHALYEQGLATDQYGLPCGEAISLGIHESQSRLWENNVGRSIGYWKANFSLLKEYFPVQMKDVSVQDFYGAMNQVKPSLVRTSADELTYHFHVMIRFEIEKAIIEGKLKTKDLPEYWNAKYKEYLGIDVPDDARGVLQDIHWSHGSFGYFPTYSLGSFYAAQFFGQAGKEIPGLEADIEKGELKPLLNWLREKVHRHGKFYQASELCKEITGEPLNFGYFMEYARKKYGTLYGIQG